jgi:membrane protease YdiL (CAAX protease family)
MTSFSRFIRSLLPADISQLLLLVGVVCLLISVDLRWAPWRLFHTYPGSLPAFRVYGYIALCAIHLAYCLGFFFCFRPGGHSARKLSHWVVLPAVFGIVLLSGICIYISMPSSVVLHGSGVSQRINSLVLIVTNMGPGFHYALMGVILILVFTSRLALDCASLPLALPDSSINVLDNSKSFDRVKLFIWALLAVVPAFHSIFPFMNAIYYFVKAHFHTANDMAAISTELFVTDVMVLLMAIWMMGRETCHVVRRSVRLPTIQGVALAIAFPVGIAAFFSAGEFLFRLSDWVVVHQSHNASLPWVGSYFIHPKVGMLLLLPASLGEEVLFRGVLQPRFILRYGLFRGLALLSIVFATLHINADLFGSFGFTDGVVILGLFVRLISSIGLCFVTGWLTLRTGSVLAAALAHGLSNMLALSPLGPTFPGIGPLTDILWMALGFVLFRYWPIQDEVA